MREILFRGRIKGNKSKHEELNWAFGDLIRELETGRCFISDLSHFDGNTKLSDAIIEVDPETVCQYTGLKDKTDKKVFEGDILNVIYSDEQGECHHAENYVLDDLRTTSVIGWLDYANELEVVGNIFDNAELAE